jgi:hypothetical protein
LPATTTRTCSSARAGSGIGAATSPAAFAACRRRHPTPAPARRDAASREAGIDLPRAAPRPHDLDDRRSHPRGRPIPPPQPPARRQDPRDLLPRRRRSRGPAPAGPRRPLEQGGRQQPRQPGLAFGRIRMNTSGLVSGPTRLPDFRDPGAAGQATTRRGNDRQAARMERRVLAAYGEFNRIAENEVSARGQIGDAGCPGGAAHARPNPERPAYAQPPTVRRCVGDRPTQGGGPREAQMTQRAE